MRGGNTHSCYTEFRSNSEVEKQADCFSVGLLMPSNLLSPIVDKIAEATLESLRTTAREFQVSLTSMMIRWASLSDFPCAMLAILKGTIAWGSVSNGFRQCGVNRILWNTKLISSDANQFLSDDTSCSHYRECSGHGYIHDWFQADLSSVSVREHYVINPYSRLMLVFITATEEELPNEKDRGLSCQWSVHCALAS